MKKIEDLLKHDTFNIFGAGTVAKRVKRSLQDAGKNIAAFIISSQTQSSSFDGIKLTSIDALEAVDTSIPLIIGVFNRERNSNYVDLIETLKEKGFNHIVTYPEYHSFYLNNQSAFWLTGKNFYSENIQNFNKVYDLLHDECSRMNYKSVIEYLRSFDSTNLPSPDFENQYFPNSIEVWNGENAFFDVGSYDGNDIYEAYIRKGKLQTVIAFEPDPANFKKLINNDQLRICAENLIIFPCGAWSENTYLRFSTGNGEASSISETGEEMIQVIRLDDVLKIKPGYIKYDIEGAEMEALNGTYEVIRNYKPSIAVSIYHRPEHLFSIALSINKWNLGYKFHLGFHANNLFETILYCIQK